MYDINTINLISSKLCLTCGICCQGIFHYHDQVPEEFGISSEPRNPILPLTCPLFLEKGNSCLIHEDPRRPPLCQTWQCQTLKRLQQGEITFEQAQTRITRIKTLLVNVLIRLQQSVMDRPAIYYIQSVYQSLKLELDSGDRSHLELYMDILLLGLLINNHMLPA